MFKKIGIAGLSIFLSMGAYAGDSVFGTAYGTELPLIWSSIITVSGGPAWGSPGQNQYLYPFESPPFIDYFHYNSTNGILATGEIFFGLQRIVQPGIIGELGIGLAGATDAKASGEVDVDGVLNVNSYDYKVDHGRVEFKGRLISNYFQLAQPYISASIGAGFNNTHAYVPVTVDPFLYPPSWFEDKTNIAFSYTLGLGIQTSINPNWQVGVGYEFADWGKNYLGVDTSFFLNNGPGLTHLYTNELLFSVSYLFSTP
jgi:hypothetical protein